MSIGIGDTVADAATGAHIANIIDEAKNKVKGIIEEFQVGTGTGLPSNHSTPASEHCRGVLSKVSFAWVGRHGRHLSRLLGHNC